nr:CD99 antigen-like protein 2 isoform X2 [Rattus norvegicus]
MVARLTALLLYLVFSLAILVQTESHFSTTTRRTGTTRASSNPAERGDHITTTTTRRPGTTRAPSNPMELDGFDLEDALDDQNDLDGPKKPSTGEGGGWSDKDLEDILGGGGYKPDKNKGNSKTTSVSRSGPEMEVCYWEWILRFQRPPPFPVSICFLLLLHQRRSSRLSMPHVLALKL